MTTAIEPAWLLHARSLVGTREAAGAANSPTIMGWARKLGTKVLGMVYNADSVPWCGLFVAACLAEDGILAAPIAVRAKAWVLLQHGRCRSAGHSCPTPVAATPATD